MNWPKEVSPHEVTFELQDPVDCDELSPTNNGEFNISFALATEVTKGTLMAVLACAWITGDDEWEELDAADRQDAAAEMSHELEGQHCEELSEQQAVSLVAEWREGGDEAIAEVLDSAGSAVGGATINEPEWYLIHCKHGVLLAVNSI